MSMSAARRVAWSTPWRRSVTARRFVDPEPERQTIERVCRAMSLALSRAGILADDVHLTLGCPLEMTPADNQGAVPSDEG
jgi:hypothetical protein